MEPLRDPPVQDADPKLLQKADPTPAGWLLPSLTSSLPLDILRQASKRLGWAGLVYAVTFSLAYFGVYLFLTGTAALAAPTLADRTVQSVVALISIAMGLAVFVLSRNLRLEPQFMLDLGLLFEVAGAFGISMSQFWGWSPEWAGANFPRYIGIPWECVWILVFPLLAPNTPGKVLLASLGAASTGPLVLLLSSASGAGNSSPNLLLAFGYFLFTTYLCAGIAYFIARTVYRLGGRLKQAREVGSYQLIRKLGQGGMGEVWVGEHRMLVRPAAIKLIRPEILAPDESSRRTVARRFAREAQATASLGSPHSVVLYDFGTTDEGGFYYVMELLEGLNLEVLVKRFGPLPPGRTIALLQQVCHSLADAHNQGLIHRDIKPANIFCCHIGLEYDFVKVLDFGLVRWSQAAGPSETRLTEAGMVAGTPAFMAPEMASGNWEVDGRADIYALGCVGYWLLTGECVFEGRTPLETIAQHLQSEPVAPSRRTELPVPEDLERVILSCLSKRPDERPNSARKLAALLTSCQDYGSWSEQKAEDWWTSYLPSPDHPATS